MREALGGGMLMYLIIPIIFLFVAFIGFIMNYASIYRAGNYIITQIETCDANLDNCTHISKDQMESVVRTKYGYHGPITYRCTDNKKGSVYRVTLGITMELPLIGKVPSNGNLFSINSESKTIYNVSCRENNWGYMINS